MLTFQAQIRQVLDICLRHWRIEERAAAFFFGDENEA